MSCDCLMQNDVEDERHVLGFDLFNNINSTDNEEPVAHSQPLSDFNHMLLSSQDSSDDRLRWALAAMCKECCLMVGPYLKHCQPVRFLGSCPSLFTWMVKDAVMAVLMKSEDRTIVYICETNVVYFAKQGYELVSGAEAVIGQFVVDHSDKKGHCPRLLVFDVSMPGTAQERYQHLQKNVVLGSCIAKQWCGERGALTPLFLQKLPHKTVGILGLTNVAFSYFTE